MPNQACIQRCEFVNYPNRDVTYGFRAYDEYGQTYLNTATLEQLTMAPLEFLKWLTQNVDDECLQEMFDSIVQNEAGLSIDGSWYDWEEIGHILSDRSTEQSQL